MFLVLTTRLSRDVCSDDPYTGISLNLVPVEVVEVTWLIRKIVLTMKNQTHLYCTKARFKVTS